MIFSSKAQLLDEIAELNKKLLTAQIDAERYRFLRDHCVEDVEPTGLLITHKQIVFQWYSPTWDHGQKQLPVPLDEAINTAIKAKR